MKTLFLLLTAFILCLNLEAKIYETAHFEEIKNHITPETLILLDIDDTLLIPAQMLGCDEWFMDRLKQNKASGLSQNDTLEKTIAEWEAIRQLTQMEIVENRTDEIVQELQDQGYTIMGLTTQGLALATRTSQQLKANKIDLQRTSPSADDFYFCLHNHGILYRDGILFTSGRAKGIALFTLLDHLKMRPQTILFINDKATHLADVEAEAEKRGVTFIGLRYAYSDKKKAAYNKALADFQFNQSTLNHLLSDVEAMDLMSSFR